MDVSHNAGFPRKALVKSSLILIMLQNLRVTTCNIDDLLSSCSPVVLSCLLCC